MARIAPDLGMRASQRISRPVVVEMIGFPSVLIVARFTFGTVSSGMDILDPVAIHT